MNVHRSTISSLSVLKLNVLSHWCIFWKMSLQWYREMKNGSWLWKNCLCSLSAGTITTVGFLSTELTLMSLTDNQIIMENGHRYNCHFLVFPHVQTELPLLQFVPVAPCPVTGHHWKESGPVLLTPTLQIFICIDKVPSQPSLLQAEQAQLPQPFLTGDMLQSTHHLHRPCQPEHVSEGSFSVLLTAAQPNVFMWVISLYFSFSCFSKRLSSPCRLVSDFCFS